MSGLLSLQQEMARYLLSEADAAALQQAVKVPPHADPAGRLEVYAHAYRERLRETLARDYPVLLHLLGPAVFADLAYAYIDAHHSRSPDIRWYGAELAPFIARQRGLPAAAHDTALFEWTIGLAFDAADAAPLAVGDLAAVPPAAWAALRFAFHPSLRVIALLHAVPDWWLAAQDRDGPAAPPALAPAAPAPKGEGVWAVWRGGDGVRFRLLEEDEAGMVQAAIRGEDFGQLCERLSQQGRDGQAAARAAGLLRHWVDAGWIAGLNGINPPPRRA